jgi:Cys-rich repeat protein
VRRAFACICALAAASCGLLPAPGPAPPIPGDGVAAFGSAAPIQLCLGTANVVPPEASTDADAVCVAGGASGATCTGDGDCSGIEACVCGQCIIQACQGATACGNGLVCRDGRCTPPCSADSDCPSGGQCDTGGCTRGCSLLR